MTEILIGIGVFLAALATAFLKGLKSAKTAQKLDTLKKDAKANDRINKVAPAGDDTDNRKRLRNAAQQLGN
jgi:hypothetical protein